MLRYCDQCGVGDDHCPHTHHLWAVLVNECLWNRYDQCLGDQHCCLFSADDFDPGDDPF